MGTSHCAHPSRCLVLRTHATVAASNTDEAAQGESLRWAISVCTRTQAHRRTLESAGHDGASAVSHGRPQRAVLWIRPPVFHGRGVDWLAGLYARVSSMRTVWLGLAWLSLAWLPAASRLLHLSVYRRLPVGLLILLLRTRTRQMHTNKKQRAMLGGFYDR